MIDVIDVKNFYKSFDSTQVIKDLSFKVLKGDLFAFLGQNGSGKTTTLRCLLNIYKRDSGEMLFLGKEYSVDMSKYLGYLPEERGLYTNAKVLETLIYFGQLKGLSYFDAKDAGFKYLKRVGLEDKITSQIKSLSSGQQQKIQLGISVINRPQVLILDEPTKGLDPVNRSLLLEILMELNKEGSTIIFSTHQMDEAERIANRLLMIKDGKSVLYGEVDKVKKEFGENTIILNYKGKFVENKDLYKTEVVDTNYAEINPNDGVSEDKILKYLVSTDISISKFEVSSPSLDEIFIKIASDKSNE